ncbi:MAG TPA: HD domain-containing protein [Longimicrobiaceae bacterium]
MATTSAQTALSSPSRLLGGITVSDTPLIREAMEYAREHSEPYLYNHAVRSWLFAVRLAQLRQTAHDPEVIAVGTLLHDIGLTAAASGPRRFEVEGADCARSMAERHGLDERRAQLIWDTVALNSTPSIAAYKETEVALCTAGIGLDWGGFGYDQFPPEEMRGILAAFPRLDMKLRFTDAVCGICISRPETTYDNFARDFGERFVPGYQRPSVVDHLLNAPFED